ncbi:hypothetical protein PF008_g27651 [Phytophthora fragariae]|uniref:Uncharacterized protein n=1 Tax=Phytophthora fragariae TaxID=53985 RepID=A0A6G0QDJ6_9STRA|nr:hypothetical protein PF008_g27651 [Phytophthora fragariae]
MSSSQSRSDGAQSPAQDGGVAEQYTKTKKKKRGYRKAVHAIRKEEIERLRVEMAQLKQQMTELQQRAIAPKRDDKDEELDTNVLHNVIKRQQNAIVDVQAAMTGYAASTIQSGSPIQRTLVLPRDELTRRNTLRSMKTLKLQDARNFLSRRLSHLNPLNAMSEEHRFENDEGDYWAVRLVVSQFESAHSTKQVFDLVMYYLSNSEISISEKVGHLTVREDDDNGEAGIMQHYLSSLTGKGLRMESNTVIFHEYHEAGPDNPQDAYGLVVSEFVDEDERHPYRSKERVRKDVNAVMEVRSYTRRPRRFRDENPKEEKVVVLTQWSHSRLRRPSFPVRKDGWLELRENMDRWSQNMHKNIMETLEPAIQGRLY